MSKPGPSSRAEDDSDSDSDVDSTILFHNVLACIQQDRIPTLCLAIRKQQTGSEDDSHTAEASTPVLEEPIFGSYNVLFPVRFADGLKWLVKVPAHGTKDEFDESSTRALRSEALTMSLIKSKTSIPIPAVHDYSASVENNLGCPYIIISFVDGISLYDCWFSKSDGVSQHRSTALRDIATAMAQLRVFSFNQAGALEFNENGSVKQVVAVRDVDGDAMMRRAFEGDENEHVLFFNSGPFTDAQQYYTRYIDRGPEDEDGTHRNLIRLARLLISWIPRDVDLRKQFVLSHPDYDIQNFLVSADGHLQAIIDWDGVTSVPLATGCTSYPGWLTRDWDPAMYGWNLDMDRGVEPEGVWEDSPEVLAKHRDEYRQYMLDALRQQSSCNASSGDIARNASRIANSLYVENLFIATAEQVCRFPILEKFVGKISDLTPDADGGEDLDIFDVIEKIGGQGIGKGVRERLRLGFDRLFGLKALTGKEEKVHAGS